MRFSEDAKIMDNLNLNYFLLYEMHNANISQCL